MGKRRHVEFDIEIPIEATDEQIDEWIDYMFGDKGCMHYKNPLWAWDDGYDAKWVEMIMHPKR